MPSDELDSIGELNCRIEMGYQPGDILCNSLDFLVIAPLVVDVFQVVGGKYTIAKRIIMRHLLHITAFNFLEMSHSLCYCVKHIMVLRQACYGHIVSQLHK